MELIVPQFAHAVSEYIAQPHTCCKVSSSRFETLVERRVRIQGQDLLELSLEKIYPQVDPKTAAVAASWMIYDLALQWNRKKNHLPLEAFALQVLDLVLPIIHSR